MASEQIKHEEYHRFDARVLYSIYFDTEIRNPIRYKFIKNLITDEKQMPKIFDPDKANTEKFSKEKKDEYFGEIYKVISDINDNLVIVDSVSKRFSACGARVGCVITKNKELQQALLKFCQSRLSVATIDQIGAAALYSVDEEFYARSKEQYRRRRDAVVAGLRKIPGVLVEEPMGAFYVMARLPVDNSDKFQRWLLESFEDNNETVMFAPGAPFYETPGSGINEVRIAYILEEAKLNRAMELLGKGIARYRKEIMNV